MNYAFNTLHAHKIFAEAIDNVKSVGLMKKLGMVLEGFRRNKSRIIRKLGGFIFLWVVERGWRGLMECSIKEYGYYNETEILKLYESVGWTNYTTNPEMLKNAYNNSLKILGAYDNEKLVGVIRAVGDGYSIIYIQDILVLPQYQRKGIGTALLKKMLDEYKNVYQKILMTDNTEKNIRFYKSIGFYMDADVECRAFMKIY